MSYKNRTFMKAYQHNWYLRNRETYIARSKAWRLANPEKVKAYRQADRERKRGCDWYESIRYQIISGQLPHGTHSLTPEDRERWWGILKERLAPQLSKWALGRGNTATNKYATLWGNPSVGGNEKE